MHVKVGVILAPGASKRKRLYTNIDRDLPSTNIIYKKKHILFKKTKLQVPIKIIFKIILKRIDEIVTCNRNDKFSYPRISLFLANCLEFLSA